jgi:hypothetical protein
MSNIGRPIRRHTVVPLNNPISEPAVAPPPSRPHPTEPVKVPVPEPARAPEKVE